MSNNKQNENNNAKHQFSNTEPLTHAQRVAIANTMSNNKQTMKLYTEEQIFKYLLENGTIDLDSFILDMKPIELPSDEEIKKTMTDFDEFDPDDVAYLGGAIWMRDKIQGGNK